MNNFKFPFFFTSSEEPADVPESNIVYVSGYLVQAFLKRVPCSQYKDLNKSQELYSPSQIYSMPRVVEVRNKMFGNLTVSTEAAFNFVQELEKLFSAQIGAIAHCKKVSQKLLCIVIGETGFPFYSAECHKLFLQMFVHIRILQYLIFKNRTQSGKTWKSAAIKITYCFYILHHSTTTGKCFLHLCCRFSMRLL